MKGLKGWKDNLSKIDRHQDKQIKIWEIFRIICLFIRTLKRFWTYYEWWTGLYGFNYSGQKSLKLIKKNKIYSVNWQI